MKLHNPCVPKIKSVPKVIFLQAAEFSYEQARPKNYENDHENIFGLSVVLELKVKNSMILTFKVIYVKNQPNLSEKETNFYYRNVLITLILNILC